MEKKIREMEEKMEELNERVEENYRKIKEIKFIIYSFLIGVFIKLIILVVM